MENSLTDKERGPVTSLIKAIAITAIAYGLALGFVISEANMDYAVAAGNLTASIAELSAYLWDSVLCFGGLALYFAAPKLVQGTRID